MVHSFGDLLRIDLVDQNTQRVSLHFGSGSFDPILPYYYQINHPMVAPVVQNADSGGGLGVGKPSPNSPGSASFWLDKQEGGSSRARLERYYYDGRFLDSMGLRIEILNNLSQPIDLTAYTFKSVFIIEMSAKLDAITDPVRPASHFPVYCQRLTIKFESISIAKNFVEK